MKNYLNEYRFFVDYKLIDAEGTEQYYMEFYYAVSAQALANSIRQWYDNVEILSIAKEVKNWK